jgi:hypothetical protein
MKLEVCRPASIEAEAGAPVSLAVLISCSSNCDLSGSVIRFLAQDVILEETRIAATSTEGSEVQEFVFSAPMTPGRHDCRIVFPAQGAGGVPHAESSSPFGLVIRPHKTSLATWDLQAPLVANTSSRVKVGVRCSAGCAVSGHEIEIMNESGTSVSTARLGTDPWPGTTALYWTDACFTVPADAGVYSWAVRFHPGEPELLHDEAQAPLRLIAVRPPEHRVTIEVCANDTKAPLSDVQVRIGSFKGSTDSGGVARVAVPKGEYELNLWKAEYEKLSAPLEVRDDAVVHLELVPAPEPEDPYWMGGTSTT